MYQQYNNNQTSLTLPIELGLPKGHIVYVINAFIDSIPATVLYANESLIGRPQYSPATLLKILLFAYSRQTFSGRMIEQMTQENLAMKYLIGDPDVVPSYRTINRFRSDPKNRSLIEIMYLYFRQSLINNGIINHEALFIDGTKINADANKYSFIWRKSSEKFEARLDVKTKALYHDLIQEQVNVAMIAEDDRTSVEALRAANSALDQEIGQLDKEIAAEKPVVGGSAKKRQRRRLKKFQHLIQTDYLPRKQKYEEQQATFGDRNSYSKTDHDATFMRMKEDPMLNGQLKPGYNLQIATQSQFVLYYQVNQRPTDQRTLIPFLEKIDFEQTPVNYIVADAGYGSEQNYAYINETLNRKALIPYTMYRKEQTKRYRNDPQKFQNWHYNTGDDSYTDHHQIHFSFLKRTTRTDKYGYTRHYKVYQADEYGDPEKYYWSRTPKDHPRQISVNENWQQQKETIRQQLSSPEGGAIFAKRKIEDEPVFGNLKANLGFRRLAVRGLSAATNEIGIALMAGNLKKLAQ